MAARRPSETTAAAAAGMASLPLSSPFDDDQSVDIVSVDGYTLDQMVEFIIDAHRNRTESILSLRCSVDFALRLRATLDGKLEELDQPQIRRWEYDYHSGIAYIDITMETKLHYLCQNGIERDIEIDLGRFVVAIPDATIPDATIPDATIPGATIPDATIRDYIMKAILNVGTSPIEKEGKILKQADIALGSLHNKLPSFVCDVSYSEPRSHVERKMAQYIEAAEGEIRAVAAFKIQYPGAKWATVALRVADGSATTGAWMQHFDTIYDEKLPRQPDGQIALYISDFIGPARLPTDFCRPLAAELAAGVIRVPQVVLTYERLRKIFLKARSIYQGTYDEESDDNQEENIFTILKEGYQERLRADNAEQRVKEAEQRIKEAEQCIKEAEQRIKETEQRIKETEQRVAALEAAAITSAPSQ